MVRNTDAWTPEEKTLIALLRGTPLEIPLASCERGGLELLALTHKVLFPLADRLSRAEGTSPEWRSWAVRAALSAERDTRAVLKALLKSARLLEAAGIASIVLKGPSLASDFPRDMGDADLLIPEESLIKAISVLEDAGYAYRGFDRNMYIRRKEYRDWERLGRWSNQFEFSEPETGTLVELHTAFFETSRVYDEKLRMLKDSIGDFVAASVADVETGLRFLALEDRILLLAFHCGLKRSPVMKGFILRHLFDLKALISAGPDWKKLVSRAFRYGAAHHLLLLLTLYEELACGQLPAGFMAELRAALPRSVIHLVRLHADCLIDLRSYSAARVFFYRLLSPFALDLVPAVKLRSLLIVPLFFPRAHRMADIYGLPGRSPLVYPLYAFEPIRWAVRVFRKTFRLTVGR